MKVLQTNTLSSMSTEELINLYRQGYQLDNTPHTQLLTSVEPKTLCSKCNKIKTETMASTNSASGIFILALGIAIGALVYYNLGKWESRKLGINI